MWSNFPYQSIFDDNQKTTKEEGKMSISIEKVINDQEKGIIFSKLKKYKKAVEKFEKCLKECEYDDNFLYEIIVNCCIVLYEWKKEKDERKKMGMGRDRELIDEIVSMVSYGIEKKKKVMGYGGRKCDLIKGIMVKGVMFCTSNVEEMEVYGEKCFDECIRIDEDCESAKRYKEIMMNYRKKKNEIKAGTNKENDKVHLRYINTREKRLIFIDVNLIEIKRMLGFGLYGEMFEGINHREGAGKEKKCTIKVIHLAKEIDKRSDGLLEKLHGLCIPKHENISHFYGYSFMKKEEDGVRKDILLLIGDYYEKTLASEWESLNVIDLLNIFDQILNGLKYLHTPIKNGEKTLLLNLKISNICLTDDNVPKIRDYGLDFLKEHTYFQYSRVLADIRWLPLEMYTMQKKNRVVDERSDIFMFGLMLYNCFVGDIPSGNVTSWNELHLKIQNGKRFLKRKSDSVNGIITNIIESCVNAKQSARISIQELKEKICRLKKCYDGNESSSKSKVKREQKLVVDSFSGVRFYFLKVINSVLEETYPFCRRTVLDMFKEIDICYSKFSGVNMKPVDCKVVFYQGRITSYKTYYSNEDPRIVKKMRREIETLFQKEVFEKLILKIEPRYINERYMPLVLVDHQPFIKKKTKEEEQPFPKKSVSCSGISMLKDRKNSQFNSSHHSKQDISTIKRRKSEPSLIYLSERDQIIAGGKNVIDDEEEVFLSQMDVKNEEKKDYETYVKEERIENEVFVKTQKQPILPEQDLTTVGGKNDENDEEIILKIEDVKNEENELANEIKQQKIEELQQTLENEIDNNKEEQHPENEQQQQHVEEQEGENFVLQ